jgi:DNA-binding NtrC family response regulator
MRLGGTDTIKVDVRILAASNENLMKLVRDGRFREDLYHRLNVISLQLPPLRDRKEDIPLLVDRFVEAFCLENGKPPRRFTHGAMKLLMDYDWPGNVRELENAVERAIVLSTQEAMDVDLLPESIRTREIVKGVRLQLAEFMPRMPGDQEDTGGTNHSASLFEILEEVERRIIVDMLERTNWNQTEAAEHFQIPLSTLNQKIKRLGIETRRRSNGARGAAAGFGDEPADFPAGK